MTSTNSLLLSPPTSLPSTAPFRSSHSGQSEIFATRERSIRNRKSEFNRCCLLTRCVFVVVTMASVVLRRMKTLTPPKEIVKQTKKMIYSKPPRNKIGAAVSVFICLTICLTISLSVSLSLSSSEPL